MSEQPNTSTVYPDVSHLAPPKEPLSDHPWPLSREALLLNDDAYRVMRDHENPMGRGAVILLYIVLIAAIARLIGLFLGYMTTPRIDLIQQSIYDTITQIGLFANRTSPEFKAQFQQIYESIWLGLRLLGGYPSSTGTFAAVIVGILGTYINWLLYGLIAHWVARWFGGEARLTQFYGALALTYSPLLLTVILVVPGASIAVSLIFLAMLVSKYLAVKTTYGLNPGSSAAVVAAPYLLTMLVTAALVIFGAAYRIGQIPYIDEIINSIQIFACFSGFDLPNDYPLLENIS